MMVRTMDDSVLMPLFPMPISGETHINHNRVQISIHVSFRATYLPVWKKLVDQKAMVGVMSGISAVNGIPSAANKYLLNDVLRQEWNFTGYVISIKELISYNITISTSVCSS